MPKAKPLILLVSYTGSRPSSIRRVDHAAAKQLNPARVLALAAAFAAAEDAADLHVCAGLGEGEEAGEEARLHRRTKEGLHRMVERAFQVAEGDVRVDAQAFDLLEAREVCRVFGLIAIDLAGDDEA
jgi:hypothetical protein